MPNQRSKDKKRVNLWMSRELFRRCEIYAQLHMTSVTEMIVEEMAKLTINIELTRDDYKKIWQEMQERRQRKR